MPAGITAVFGRFTNALREFTVGQRTIAIIGVAVLVVGAIALGAWFTRSTYSPLFSGLNGSDASAIVDQLDADGVSYQLADGGQTILVPDSDVNSARLKAAAAGLPSLDNGGYALLDAMGVTASEFQQSVTYKRAIEGELASTIESITGVRTASVKLAIPEESVFVSEKLDPTASVFVDTESGVTLNADQVQSITHLTAAAVDGLTPQNVSVVSADGTVLSAVGTGMTGSSDQQAGTYEDKVRSSVQSMLDRLVGPGNATVAVAASMSGSSGQRVSETFTTPEGSPVLQEQTTSQNYGAGVNGTGTTGVLGADSIAVPTDTADDAGTGAGEDGAYVNETANRTNAINKVTETTSIPAGQIERQTVSVAVDKDAAAGMSASVLEGLVAAAAGIDTDRGDAVEVELVSFAKVDSGTAAAALEEARASELQSSITQIVTTALPVLGVIIVLIILMSGLRSSRKRKDRQDATDLGEMTQVRDPLEAGQATAIDAAAAAGLLPPVQPLVAGPSAFADFGPDLDESSTERMRQEIDSLAAQSPERMAEHLRSLMDDRSRA